MTDLTVPTLPADDPIFAPGSPIEFMRSIWTDHDMPMAQRLAAASAAAPYLERRLSQLDVTVKPSASETFAGLNQTLLELMGCLNADERHAIRNALEKMARRAAELDAQ
jgi:hypothetical protein